VSADFLAQSRILCTFDIYFLSNLFLLLHLSFPGLSFISPSNPVSQSRYKHYFSIQSLQLCLVELLSWHFRAEMAKYFCCFTLLQNHSIVI
jgi:hypothetical protein